MCERSPITPPYTYQRSLFKSTYVDVLENGTIPQDGFPILMASTPYLSISSTE